jgi:hypothetical protein
MSILNDGRVLMLVAETFWQVIWTIFIFFLWVMWLWLLIGVFSDLFRNHEMSGWAKAGWCVFVILLPFLGVFVYLIAEGKGMAHRNQKQVQAAEADFDARVRAAAAQSDPAGQIANAKQLLDSGTITAAEFDQLKARALAT